MKKLFTYTFGVLVAVAGLFSGSVFAQAPANDSLCNAQLLLVTDTCTTVTNGDNTGATGNSDALGSCFSGGVNAVWFKFATPASGWVSLSTDFASVGGTNTDTEIALYYLTGSCSDSTNMVEVACDQDGGTAVTFNSIIDLAPTIGDTMYVAVSGWNGTEGTFCLDIIEVTPPAASSNDTLCNAVPILMGDTASGDNTNALFQIGEPGGWCTADNNSVWYSFTAPASGYVNISTDIAGGTNTVSDIILYALPGANCADPFDLFEMACAADFATGTGFGAVLDSFPVNPGDTYYVSVVDGPGTFEITVDEVTPAYQPANDSLCDAVTLVAGAGCAAPNGDNTNSGIEVGEPTASCFFGVSNSVWYTFTAPSSGLITLSTDIDSAFLSNDDTEIALYELPGGNCADVSDLVEVACDQDGGTAVTFNSIISAQPVTPGATYYVQVSGWAATEGSFCLTLEELFFPANDSACNAIDLPVDGSVNTFFNIGATVEAGESAIAPPLGDGGGNFAWFETEITESVYHTFTAPASGAVFIDMCNGGVGTNFDTQVAVYEVGDCADFNTFTFIGANDDLPDGSCGFASILTVNCLTPGAQYYILVDGWQADVGDYGISITEIAVDPLSATGDATDPTCPGDANGSINLTVNGGGTPYSFSWDTGDTTEDLSGLTAGTYTVTVTDGCDSTTTATVTVNAAPELFASAGDDAAFCGEADVMLGGMPTGSGGNAFESQRAYGVDLLGGGDFFQHKVGDVSDQNTISSGNGAYFAGDFAFGIFFVIDNTNQELATLDLATGAPTVLGSCVPNAGHTWTGLAFDESSSTMYAVSTDGGTSTLYTVDLGSGAATVVGDINSPIVIWLAIDNAGQGYIMDIGTDAISSVDLSTGAATLIGPTGFNSSFAQDADFDPDDNTLYLAAYNADNSTAEYRVADLNTGATTYIADFNRGEVGGFGILPETTDAFTYGWTPPLALDNPFASNPMSTTPVSTDYVVTVTDACGTSASDTISITVNQAPIAVPTAYPVFNGVGNAFSNPAGGTPPYTFEWSTGETSENIEVADSGSYTVIVTDANLCTDTATVTVGLVPTSVDELANAGINSLTAYPNPSNGTFTLKVDLVNAEALTVEIFDMKGKALFSEVSARSMVYEKVISLNSISAGVYTLKVTTEQGTTASLLTIE